MGIRMSFAYTHERLRELCSPGTVGSSKPIMIVTKVMGVVWGTEKQRWPSSASLCRCGVSFFEMCSFHFQDVKCKTPTHSQFKNLILIPGRRQKVILWPHETLLRSMPGQDGFGSVGSHQHRSGNPDQGPRGGTVILPTRGS